MIVRFSRWGNSLALRIPARVLRDVGASEGSTAEMSVQEGRIVVAPRPEPHYTFDGLLAGITKDNLHDDQFEGAAVGDEIW